MDTSDWSTIPDVVEAARSALPRDLWSWSGSGSESETTVRRNRAALDRLAFLPRVLRRVAEVDCRTMFLGHSLALPVVLAPVGLIQLFDREGARAQGRAGATAGTMSFIGTNSEPSLEEVRVATAGPLVFQLYTYGDRAWVGRLVKRVEAAGFDAICLTVDSPAAGVRDRFLSPSFERGRRSGGRPNVEPMPGDESGFGGRASDRYLGEFTWDDVAWLRDATQLPLVIKGILAVEDAVLAVDHGVQAIHVSNHGGRRQDHLPSAIEVLAGIVDAVDRRAEVIVDGGIMRGTDVVKALAIGANCVAIGKLMIWALGAGGEDGVVRVLQILLREIRATMANIGAATVGDLNRSLVTPAAIPPADIWPIEAMTYRQP